MQTKTSPYTVRTKDAEGRDLPPHLVYDSIYYLGIHAHEHQDQTFVIPASVEQQAGPDIKKLISILPPNCVVESH